MYYQKCKTFHEKAERKRKKKGRKGERKGGREEILQSKRAPWGSALDQEVQALHENVKARDQADTQIQACFAFQPATTTYNSSQR